jgi:hypothetical protein
MSVTQEFILSFKKYFGHKIDEEFKIKSSFEYVYWEKLLYKMFLTFKSLNDNDTKLVLSIIDSLSITIQIKQLVKISSEIIFILKNINITIEDAIIYGNKYPKLEIELFPINPTLEYIRLLISKDTNDIFYSDNELILGFDYSNKN